MSRDPKLPEPRGEISAAVTEALRTAPPGPAAWQDLDAAATAATAAGADGADGTDPYGEDAQLALYCAYELHYRGFAGVDPEWEWDPGLLRLRGGLESSFLTSLRGALPCDADVAGALAPLLTEPVDGGGVSHFLHREGRWWQVREYLAHRSLYHLKEADPQAWVLPRLAAGQAKAALAGVEFDEYGGGRGERVHAALFAEMMTEAGLDAAYGRHLDVVPAPMLAVVNLMSLFGLHRSLRGALVGQFAAVETGSSPGSRRMAEALRRLGAGPACLRFYEEHVTADAVHEQVVRHEVVGDLVRREPALAADIAFGVRATGLVEDRLESHLLRSWSAGRTSLRRYLSLFSRLSWLLGFPDGPPGRAVCGEGPPRPFGGTGRPPRRRVRPLRRAGRRFGGVIPVGLGT